MHCLLWCYYSASCRCCVCCLLGPGTKGGGTFGCLQQGGLDVFGRHLTFEASMIWAKRAATKSMTCDILNSGPTWNPLQAMGPTLMCRRQSVEKQNRTVSCAMTEATNIKNPIQKRPETPTSDPATRRRRQPVER